MAEYAYNSVCILDYVKGHDIHKRAVKPKKYQFGEESTYKAAKAIYMFTKVNHILHFGSIAVLATLCTEVTNYHTFA